MINPYITEKLNPLFEISNIKYKLIAARSNIGKTDVTKILQIFVCGKKSNMNQKGNTPKFNHI